MTAAAARIAEPMIASIAARPNLPMPLLTIITSSTGRHEQRFGDDDGCEGAGGMAPAKKSAKVAHDAAASNGSDSTDSSRKPAVKVPIRRGRMVAMR